MSIVKLHKVCEKKLLKLVILTISGRHIRQRPVFVQNVQKKEGRFRPPL
jgi:hypothetical protein